MYGCLIFVKNADKNNKNEIEKPIKAKMAAGVAVAKIAIPGAPKSINKRPDINRFMTEYTLNSMLLLQTNIDLIRKYAYTAIMATKNTERTTHISVDLAKSDNKNCNDIKPTPEKIRISRTTKSSDKTPRGDDL